MSDDKLLTEPDADGMRRLTAVGHRVLHRALLRSTKFLYFCKRTKQQEQIEALEAEIARWKQRAFELECQFGGLKGVFAERAALGEPKQEQGE